ncbi:YbbR-like domain-containing protein [bacterium]|nr:MAG: YbbR-like domain-containing protein [bacterium]
MEQTKDKSQLAYLWLQSKWEQLIKPDEGDGPGMTSRERITIYFICYLFAVALWALVNLGREFELTLNVPVQITNIPDNLAQTDHFLESVEVSVNGEGWMLMNLYNAEPNIEIPLNSDDKKPRINVFEYTRRLVTSYPNVNLVKVEPSVVNLSLDENITKKVPVRSNIDLEFRAQHALLDESRMYPDSITIQGAQSILKDIRYVETESLSLIDVKQDVDVEINLKQPGEFITLKRNTVRFRAKIAEFTEGEVRVFVRTENIPKGVEVKYNPAVISIRYDVPIDEYAASQDVVPYAAFVAYKDLEKDSTGFVTPVIKNLAPNLHLRIRSYQPKRVSYYNVLKED